jgi:hypothetical protein
VRRQTKAPSAFTPGRKGAIALAIALLALLALSPLAQAAPKQVGGFIGTALGGQGGQFTQPRDVAVYEGTDANAATDKLFVVEAQNVSHRVQRLDADGNFELMWGRNVVQPGAPGDTGTGYEICTIATDCQAPASGSTGTRGGELNNPQGIAVNQNTGHVYLMDRGNFRVQEFDLGGGFVRAWGWDAVDGVTNPGAPGDAGTNSFEVCTSAPACKAAANTTINPPVGEFGSNSSTGFGVAVNPANGDVFVWDGANRRVQQFSSTGAPIRAWGSDLIPGGATGTGTVTNGLTAVTAVQTTSKAFVVGQEVIGAGIAPGTTITAISTANGGTITLSQAAGAGASGAGTAITAPTGAGNAPINEKQTLALGANTTGGTFKITYATPAPSSTTATSADIPWNAPAADPGTPGVTDSVQEALEGLANIGVGNVEVSGVAGGPWTIEYKGARFADTNVSQVTAPSGNLTNLTVSGGSKTATIATTQEGSIAFEACTTSCGQAAAAGNENGRFAAASSNGGRLTADSNGIVYVGDPSTATAQGGANRIVRFDSDLAPVGPGDAGPALATPIACCSPTAAAPLVAGATLGLKIDGDTDGIGVDEEHLLVLRRNSGPTTVQELDIPTTPSDPIITSFQDSPLGELSNVNGFGTSSGTGLSFVAFGNATFGGASAQHGLIVLGPPAGALSATAEAPDPLGSSTATMRGTVNAGGSASYQFEVAKGGGSFDPIGQLRYASGSSTVPVSVAVTGLDPNSIYRVRLVVSKVTGVNTTDSAASNEQLFVTAATLPSATTVTASAITDASALLVGRANPNGSESTYHFEYGRSTSYGTTAPKPAAFIGSGTTEQLVSTTVTQLLPGTTYHFRLCATNDQGTSCGADRTFATDAASAPQPPAQRGYELVSPADKPTAAGPGFNTNHSLLDGEVGAEVLGVASKNGDRFISASTLGALLTEGNAAFVHDFALGERTPAGWVNKAMFNRREFGPVASATFLDLDDVNDSLSMMFFHMPGSQGTAGCFFVEMLSQCENSLGVHYLRDWSGDWRYVGGSTGENQRRTAFSEQGEHVALMETAASTQNPVFSTFGAGNPAADQVSGSWVAGSVDQIADTWEQRGLTDLLGVCTGEGSERTEIPGVEPSGKLGAQVCPDPLPGRDARLIDVRGSSTTASGPRRNLVSADGSRMLFMSPDLNANDPDGGGPLTDSQLPCGPGTGPNTSCPVQLYVRQAEEDGSHTTRWISGPEVANQDAAQLGPAYYQGASANGDKVFFKTKSPLTADDPNGGNSITSGSASDASWDLYRYDLPSGPDGHANGSDPADGTLTRISAGPTGSGDCSVSAGSGGGGITPLRFASEDGNRVYFTCAAPLPGVPTTGNGTITSPGGTPTTTDLANLYLYDATKPNAERWEFVAQLPRENPGNSIPACATTSAGRGNGRLASPPFPIDAGYSIAAVNCMRGTADAKLLTFWTLGRLTADDTDDAADIYAFDAEAHRLTRISAPQGGPGGSYVCEHIKGEGVLKPPTATTECNADLGFGSEGGDVYTYNRGVATTPSGERVAFFESKSRLVPEDKDGFMDTYEWRDGELTLISTGIESGPAIYAGNDASGQDVFFVTEARLTWQDIDGVRDVYDARIGGGIPEPPTPGPTCDVLAGACAGSGAESPVALPPAASLGATGANVVERATPPRRCTKGKVRRKGKCVSKKKSKRAERAKRRAGK